jgi:hypothetical protein
MAVMPTRADLSPDPSDIYGSTAGINASNNASPIPPQSIVKRI